MYIVIKHPHGRMRVYPDVLIQKMTLAGYRKWVKFFAKYGNDDDIAEFKGRLEQAKDDLFSRPRTRAWKRVVTMQEELDEALKKEERL